MKANERRSRGSWIAAAGVTLLGVSIAVGHGGGHEPPPPKGPPPPPYSPPFNGPGDVNRPLPGAKPQTPGGRASGPSAPGPSAPGAPPQNPGPAAATTQLSGGVLDLTRWELWWKFNRHEFLGLKDAVWSEETITASDDSFFLGHGARAPVAATLRPTEDQLTERIIPALIDVLKREGQPGVLSGCLMALAKIGDLPPVGEEDSAAVIREFLKDSNQQMGETAALALGVFGRPSTLFDLGSLIADDRRGRELTGKSRVPLRTRAFAAYGIGILAGSTENPDVRRFAVHLLARELEGEKTSTKDIGVACVNALGLAGLRSVPEHFAEEPAPPPSASREALLRFLLERFGDSRLDDRVRAHLPRAMVTILPLSPESTVDDTARTELAAELVGAIQNTRTDREVRYGCAIGLGMLGTAGAAKVDIEIVRALEKTLITGDTTARNLALIALGRISGRRGAARSMEQLPAITTVLLRTLARGKSRTRPWAALALGVQGFYLRRLDLDTGEEVVAALRSAFLDCGSPEDVGAYALALGLRGDIGSSPDLRNRLFRFNDDLARGAIALSLGLTGDQESIEFLHRFLSEAAYRPDFLRPLVIGLALLGDKSLVPELTGKIEETKSSSRKAVYAWALAHVGDSRAVEPVLAMLADEDLPKLSRGIAALGAGFIAERQSRPWNAELAIGVNYFANPETLFAPAGGGILNIR